MAKQSLGLGSAANDNTGDTLRAGGDKINDNFNEIYTALGNGSNLQVSLANPASGQVLRYNGTSFIPSDYSNLTSALDVNGNSIISSSNGNIALAANGTGDITLAAGSVTSTFDGDTGQVDIPTKVKYKNEYATLSAAPALLVRASENCCTEALANWLALTRTSVTRVRFVKFSSASLTVRHNADWASVARSVAVAISNIPA